MIVFAHSTADWQQYTDKTLHVTFRYPKQWKTSPLYYDGTYFEGTDRAVQLSAAGGANPRQVCQGLATHHLQPFGTHPGLDPNSRTEGLLSLAVQRPSAITRQRASIRGGTRCGVSASGGNRRKQLRPTHPDNTPTTCPAQGSPANF
jgi:hypothetical protein